MTTPCLHTAVAALGLMLIAQPAQALTVDQPYVEVRQELFADGWTPKRWFGDAGDQHREERCSFRYDICNAYGEVERCHLDEAAQCLFVFERQGRTLVIATKNKAVADLIVTGWTEEWAHR